MSFYCRKLLIPFLFSPVFPFLFFLCGLVVLWSLGSSDSIPILHCRHFLIVRVIEGEVGVLFHDAVGVNRKNVITK